MVERSRKKKQQEEGEKQQHVIVTESSLFKGFTKKDIQNFNRNLSACLTATVDSAANLMARKLPQPKEFHATPL